MGNTYRAAAAGGAHAARPALAAASGPVATAVTATRVSGGPGVRNR